MEIMGFSVTRDKNPKPHRADDEGERAAYRPMTDSEREVFIERHRAELPELDRIVEKNLRKLREIAKS